jgi:hypothetical protein
MADPYSPEYGDPSDHPDDEDWLDEEDLPGFQGWTRQGTPIQEF